MAGSGSANLSIPVLCQKWVSEGGKKHIFPAEQIEHSLALYSSCCKWHENDDFLSMPKQSINRMLFLQEKSHALVVAYIKLTTNVFLC